MCLTASDYLTQFPYKAALFHDSHSAFPARHRDQLRSLRGELYKAAATAADKANGDGFNDDDIYGEQETKPQVPVEDKPAAMELDALGDLAVIPQTWLCTSTEQGVLKVCLRLFTKDVQLWQLG